MSDLGKYFIKNYLIKVDVKHLCYAKIFCFNVSLL